MENANSKDYLDKIKNAVIENLKKTAHAPSVQMTEVPRTTMTGGTEEDEDILDDEDEDNNKDARNTTRRWDKHITRDDELDESDDEEEARANGVLPQNGVKKRRNIGDYKNPHAAASDIEMDSGIATPQVDDVVEAMAVEANAELNAEILGKKVLAVAESDALGPSNAPSQALSTKAEVDTDGDIAMTEDPAPASAPAPPETKETEPAPPATAVAPPPTSAEVPTPVVTADAEVKLEESAGDKAEISKPEPEQGPAA